MDIAAQIARTVLYEGYVLWPYRRSALKNRQRWTFGTVFPREYVEKVDQSERSQLTTQCLLAAPDGAQVQVRVRCLQIVRRQVLARMDGSFAPVDSLEADGRMYLTWEEAAERELALPPIHVEEEASTELSIPFVLAEGSSDEPVSVDGATAVGMIRRSWNRIEGVVRLAVETLDERRLRRVTVSLQNLTPVSDRGRSDVLLSSLASTHLVLRVQGGAFVSLENPPEEHAAIARQCNNDGLWPVLLGEDGAHDSVLAAPIILYDHPRVAPESPGDFFDGGEIDQLLVLNTLALTDSERAEMRASDPQTADILDRCERMSHEDFLSLHGVFRNGMSGRAPEPLSSSRRSAGDHGTGAQG